jgi:hypothetical protein
MKDPPYFCNEANCAPCCKLERTHPEPAPPLDPCAVCKGKASHTRGGIPRCDDHTASPVKEPAPCAPSSS